MNRKLIIIAILLLCLLGVGLVVRERSRGTSEMYRATQAIESFPATYIVQDESQVFNVEVLVTILQPPFLPEMQKMVPSGRIPLHIEVIVSKKDSSALTDVRFALQLPEKVSWVTNLPIFYVSCPVPPKYDDVARIESTSLWFLPPITEDSQEYFALKEAFSESSVIRLVHRGGEEFLAVTARVSIRPQVN